jgi:hypothetical protein
VDMGFLFFFLPEFSRELQFVKIIYQTNIVCSESIKNEFVTIMHDYLEKKNVRCTKVFTKWLSRCRAYLLDIIKTINQLKCFFLIH